MQKEFIESLEREIQKGTRWDQVEAGGRKQRDGLCLFQVLLKFIIPWEGNNMEIPKHYSMSGESGSGGDVWVVPVSRYGQPIHNCN
jgi:hypothetical protein